MASDTPSPSFPISLIFQLWHYPDMRCSQINPSKAEFPLEEALVASLCESFRKDDLHHHPCQSSSVPRMATRVEPKKTSFSQGR